jgi:glycerol kinase
MQMQADFAGTTILRPDDVEATARGAAVLAGLGAGLWERADAVPRPPVRRFEPQVPAPARRERLAAWRAAVARTLTRDRNAPGGSN